MKNQTTSKKIEALSKISRAITSDLYIEDILKLIVTITAEVLGSKICSLMLLDERGYLQIRATQSVSEGYNKKPPLKIGEGIAGRVALENKPLAIYNLLENKEYKSREIAKKEGLASLLCVPLFVKKKVIGVINLYTSKPHKFTKSETHLLTTIANQAALVIENTELIVKTKVIQEELQTRKIVERAKGIIMKDQGVSEEEAYRKIQKYSMDSRKSMREVSEAIILSKDISGNK